MILQFVSFNQNHLNGPIISSSRSSGEKAFQLQWMAVKNAAGLVLYSNEFVNQKLQRYAIF